MKRQMSKQYVKYIAYAGMVLSFVVMFSGLFVSGMGIKQGIDASKLGEEQLMIVNDKKEQQLFNVELALTVEQQQRGLMNREKMDDDHGMLFVYNRVQETAMWMKNTIMPLDMLFIDNDGKILSIYENARPYDEKAISSQFPVRATLELKGGQVAARGIKVGDTVFNSYFGNTNK